MALALASGKDILSENTAHEIAHRYHLKWGGEIGLDVVRKVQAVLAEMDERERPPLHAFEIRISIGANTEEFLRGSVQEIYRDFWQKLPENDYRASAGSNGCYSIAVAQRDVTPHQFQKEMDDWLERSR